MIFLHTYTLLIFSSGHPTSTSTLHSHFKLNLQYIYLATDTKSYNKECETQIMSSNSIENTIDDSSSGNDEIHQPMLPDKQPSQEPVISSELEDVLSDTSLSYFKRLQRATFIELKTLFQLAGPAVVVYLLNNVISMSTQILCGHLGNLELAASSLGNNGIQIFAYGLMVTKQSQERKKL